MATLTRTIELDPDYPYWSVFLGSIYAALRRYQDAIASYQKAITLGLDTPSTQIALGAGYALRSHAGARHPRPLAVEDRLCVTRRAGDAVRRAGRAG